jgi:hypothetical protein
MGRWMRMLAGAAMAAALLVAVGGTGARGAEGIPDDFRISGPGATDAEIMPAVAWNDAADQYLVVWEDSRNNATRADDIYGQILTEAGARVGSNFRISGTGATADDLTPAVVWNGTAQEYLVVWQDARNEATRGTDIYGQRVSATGSLLGSNFRVVGKGATTEDSDAAVVWNGTSNQYLIVWEDDRRVATRGQDLYGRLLAADGTPDGGDFRISGPGATALEGDPAVSWSGTANEYLVAWIDGRNLATRNRDIYGQRLSATGAAVGANFRISGPGATTAEDYPAVAWDDLHDQYLVVWVDWRQQSTRSLDIYGQVLTGAGDSLGGNFRVVGTGGVYEENFPAVAWNGTTRQYLVVWHDGRAQVTRGWEIYGQRVSYQGSRVGPDFQVSGPAATSSEYDPAVAWSSMANRYLVVWQDMRDLGTRSLDIYGQRVAG